MRCYMARNSRKFFFRTSVAVLFMLLVFAQAGHASTIRNPLKMFKRYFGTIEIVSNGIGTRGTGQIDTTPGLTNGLSLTKCPNDTIGCTLSVAVPANAEIVAAFVYYEILEKKSNKPISAAVYLRDPD